MDEWERAEPGFKPMTDEELKAKFARQDRDWDQWRAEYAQRVEANKQRYDPEREQARLELLELKSWLRHEVAGIAKLRSGEAYPKMDPQRRAQQITELDERIRRHQAAVERLSPIVGDPEDVVDEHGLLPSDRRPTMLYYYREWRVQKVQRLRVEIAELDAGMAAAEDKTERSRLGIQRQITKCQLDEWLAVPRMQAEDMCADCLTPAAYHERGGPFTGGLCSAWPENAKKLREVREMLRQTARSSADASPQPSKPKPQPLAVVPSGLPIAEVVRQLQKLQKQYPDAEVRRGRANRWELWPKEGQNRPAKKKAVRAPQLPESADGWALGAASYSPTGNGNMYVVCTRFLATSLASSSPPSRRRPNLTGSPWRTLSTTYTQKSGFDSASATWRASSHRSWPRALRPYAFTSMIRPSLLTSAGAPLPRISVAVRPCAVS
jgi:hypothetical protein